MSSVLQMLNWASVTLFDKECATDVKLGFPRKQARRVSRPLPGKVTSLLVTSGLLGYNSAEPAVRLTEVSQLLPLAPTGPPPKLLSLSTASSPRHPDLSSILQNRPALCTHHLSAMMQ